MDKNNTDSCSRSSATALVIILAIYSLLSIFTHQHTRLTADSMLYFSLAQKYLAGDFQNAINGYWGPLLAWLIVPFMYLGISDVWTINILNLIFGVLTFIGIWLLSYRFELSEKIRTIFIITSFPIVLKFSLVQPMDFLLAGILILYLAIVFRNDYFEQIRYGMFSGMLGALAYFTKAYAFHFFIVHFFIMNILHYFRNNPGLTRKKVIKNALMGFAMFSIISGTWIMIISDKYGHFTFSTMRDTNFNAPGPEVKGGGLEFGVPVFYEGLFPPPNDTAFVIWEDPSYLRGNRWSAWQSKEHFIHFIKLILKNIAEGLKFFESFSTFSIAIIMAYILFLSGQIKDKTFLHGEWLYPLFTLILYSGGFVLFHFEERYIWLANVLLLLMGGHLITLLFQKEFFGSNLRKNILIAFFVVSFIFVPSRFIMQTSAGSVDNDMYELSLELKPYNIKGNAASNRELGSHEAWHKTFRLAYWLEFRYYGQAGEGVSNEDLENELRKYGINYYFFWGETSQVPQFLYNYQEVTNGEIPGLKIYSLER